MKRATVSLTAGFMLMAVTAPFGHKMVDIPNIGTDEKLGFERLFEKWLEQKRNR